MAVGSAVPNETRNAYLRERRRRAKAAKLRAKAAQLEKPEPKPPGKPSGKPQRRTVGEVLDGVPKSLAGRNPPDWLLRLVAHATNPDRRPSTSTAQTSLRAALHCVAKGDFPGALRTAEHAQSMHTVALIRKQPNFSRLEPWQRRNWERRGDPFGSRILRLIDWLRQQPECRN